jgi:cyclophilin family peptidyl-prolyl cis-trans isomerase
VTVHFEGVGAAESPSDQTFSIELAPIKYVPHAVHFFLEQVSHGLWNHSAFHLNHHHVLQVGPSTPEHRDRFRDLELDRLAFPDYSPHYPHHRWTLGFAGRPGGPSWYVNKIDNRADHGPHGQEHHALSEFADSCFGRIVDGFDVLERVFAGAARATILSAAVVNWHDHSDHGFDYDAWHKEHEEYHDSSEYDEDGSDDWFAGDDDRHIHPHADDPEHEHEHRNHYHHVSTDSAGALHSPATPSREGRRSHPSLEQLKSYYSTQQTKQEHRHRKK